MDFINALSHQFSVKPEYIANILSLLDDGNTVPFIARYRKEMHGTQDDQTIREIAERYEYLQGLDKRREEVRSSIDKLGFMTDEISAALDTAETLAEIEDIYRPYKPKKRTRAIIAREKGLEPLAMAIYAQERDSEYPIDMAERFVDPEKGVETALDAIKGAQDIIAELISDDAGIRKRLRYVAFQNGKLRSRAVDPENDSVYRLYYNFSEPLNRIAGYRVLAIDRGEREEFLKASIEFDRDKAMRIIHSVAVKQGSPCTDTVIEAAEDAYDRLIFPSIERELRSTLTGNADDAAIKVFASNLRQLLMQPPIKGRTVIGLDPGYRTGCKVAVVDSTGRVLDTGVIYPAKPHEKIAEARTTVSRLIKKHGATAISIGNGTASKETEIFVSDLLHDFPDVKYMVVSESGASVYSASKLAAAEFPDYDVSLRSAVSIARRMQDPLAELVKIEPKAIGVGQYQHDMPQKQLGEALGGVVEDCVNTVGVDLNTASPSLLSYVAGISSTVAKNIVTYREENGAFHSRRELLKVAKLGPKAFEQCAGFMRVPESSNVLDNTAVHPESYTAASALLELCGFSMKDVSSGNISELPERVAAKGAESIAAEIGIGVPTLEDIVKELLRPGRDLRDDLPQPMLRSEIMDMNDLVPGMELDGTVRNVVDFGAFVDI
ncbi:MAG: RNA-binding transcriptional accessory protein, partial [Ruminococcaceae bacterium]|nr:RNA-binding transcriptional accessory protein [Oscillospiraceae bacterium]